MGNCTSARNYTPKTINLCYERKWDEVTIFLGSDATEKKKIESLMYKYNDVWTCLHEACSYRAPLQVIEAMIQIGGRKLLREGTSTALHNSCTRRFGASAEIVKLLIDKGGKDLVMQRDHHGRTALHGACRCGACIEIVKVLVNAGGKDLVLQKDNHGRTALHGACRYGAPSEVVQILIATGGKDLVMQSTNHGESALHEVRIHKKTKYSEALGIIRSLIVVGGRDLLMQKHKYGHTALKRVYMYITSQTPLWEMKESLEMLKWMYEQGVLQSQDIEDYNLLVESCYASDPYAVEKFMYLVKWNPKALKNSIYNSIFHEKIEQRVFDRDEALLRFRMVLNAAVQYFTEELGFLFQTYREGDDTTVLEHAYKEFGIEDAWKVVQECLEENDMHDCILRTNLRPFMLGAAGDSSDLSIVYYLFRSNPIVLVKSNKNQI